jgi:hypothetical protein
MWKALGVSILILFVSVIVYVLIYSFNGEGRYSFADFDYGNLRYKAMSIKQIDSLTAALDYNFTVKNRIVHNVSQDSLKTPLKTEKPAG